MGPNPLETLFNPSSIAVFGASQSGTSVGSRVFANLMSAGFSGTVVAVNPKYKSIAGHPCYPTINDVDEAIDLAVIATPAKTIPGIIKPALLIIIVLVCIQAVSNLFADWNKKPESHTPADEIDEAEIENIRRTLEEKN